MRNPGAMDGVAGPSKVKMDIVTETVRITRLLEKVRSDRKTVGFVPTMGNLHRGHLSLVDAARSENDLVVLSIFVNPTQFGPKEDYLQYPRTIDQDIKQAEAKGVDVLFLPSVEGMYPRGYSVYVSEDELSRNLCGAHRPGHFRGVLTIVLKLLHLVKPERLYLGKKDIQQLRLITKMIEDFNIDVQVVGIETVREDDGLALSSRNQYLDFEDRSAAPIIYQGLTAARRLYEDDAVRDAEVLVATVRKMIASNDRIRIQYIELSDYSDLSPIIGPVNKRAILAFAGFLGATRLIDNLILGGEETTC